ncbi:MAG: hypothetical protein Q9181_004011, partial [Wetmoreana brouardii]
MQLQIDSEDGARRFRASYIWVFGKTDEEVCLFKNKTKIHTLQPTYIALQHGDDTEDDNEPGLSLFTIVADLESGPVNSQYYNHSLHGEGAESIDTGVEKIYEHRLKTFSIRSSEFGGDHQLVSSVFVALGWLVEHNKDLYDEFSASGGSAKGDPPPFLEAHTDFGDMANPTLQQDKAQKHEEGYFGLPPFDLALLAADIND